MIGRYALDNQWIFEKVDHLIFEKKFKIAA